MVRSTPVINKRPDPAARYASPGSAVLLRKVSEESMWRSVWHEVREILWLMTMLVGLSITSLAVAASFLAITEMRLATLVPLLSGSLT
jgi:hypothetical protein